MPSTNVIASAVPKVFPPRERGETDDNSGKYLRVLWSDLEQCFLRWATGGVLVADEQLFDSVQKLQKIGKIIINFIEKSKFTVYVILSFR